MKIKKLKLFLASIITFITLAVASLFGVLYNYKFAKPNSSALNVSSLNSNAARAVQTYEDEYFYYEYDDGYNGEGPASAEVVCKIIGVKENVGGMVTIPSNAMAAGGAQITSISSSAFAGNLKITGIVLPGSIYIDPNAFENCTNLTSVTIEYEEELSINIGDEAFAGCVNLMHVRFDCDYLGSFLGYTNEATFLGGLFRYASIIQVKDCGFEFDFTRINKDWQNKTITIDSNNYIQYYKAPTVDYDYLNFSSNNDGTCIVTYAGFDFPSVYIPNVSPEGDMVTTISGFTGCAQITDVVIANGITTIENGAFNDCENLQHVTIPASLWVDEGEFSGCYRLVSATIENPFILEKLANSEYNSNLLANNCWIYVPTELVSQIGGSLSFYDYTEYFYNSDYELAYYCYENSTNASYYSYFDNITTSSNGDGTCRLDGVNPDSDYYALIPGIINGDIVTSINAEAFANNSFKSIMLPNTIYRIQESAFHGIESNMLILPDSVRVIENNAFNDCNFSYFVLGQIDEAAGNRVMEGSDDTSYIFGVDSGNSNSPVNIIFTNKTYTIPNYMFHNCTGIQYLSLPSALTSIGDYAFENCSYLLNFNLPKGLTYIGQNAFAYTLTNESAQKSITIPECVTELNGTFSGCSALEDVNLPDFFGVVSTGAFSYTGLTSLTIPTGVTNVETDAFYHCTNLKTVIIENSDIYKDITDKNTSVGGALKYATTIKVNKYAVDNNTNSYMDTNYKKTLSSGYYTFEPKPEITSDNVTLSGTRFTYTGKEITPEVTVVIGGKTLTKDVDYTIAYLNNINKSSNARVKVVGQGDYVGTATKYFSIIAKTLDGVDLVGVELTEWSLSSDASGEATCTFTKDGNNVTFNISAPTTHYSTITGSIYVEFDEYYTKVLNNPQQTYGSSSGGTITSNSIKSFKDDVITFVIYFNGGMSSTFTVKLNFTGVRVIISDEVYTGSQVIPSTLTLIDLDNGNTLALGTDYTVTYSDNINAGFGYANIVSKGNYQGMLNQNFNILPIEFITTSFEVASATVMSSAAKSCTMSYEKVGEAYNFHFRVESNSYGSVTTNVEGVTFNADFTEVINNPQTTEGGSLRHYITSLQDGVIRFNVAAGMAAYVNVNIVKTSNINIADIADQNMTGSAVTPDVDITDIAREVKLVNGTDYTLSYENNITTGTATVTITGKGNYTGVTSKTFEITTKLINGEDVNVSAIADQVFTGSNIEPSVTLFDTTTSSDLVLNTDYTIKYENNLNVGTAKIIITGKGSYSGTREIEFNITAKSIGLSGHVSILDIGEQTYTGNKIEPVITVKDADRNANLVLNKDYTVNYTNNQNKGNATVTITGIGNYTGTNTTFFTILARSISGAVVTLSFDSITFNNTSNLPEVTSVVLNINGEDKTLATTDYRVSYKNADGTQNITEAIAVGDYLVTVEGIGNYEESGNFIGIVTKPFSITAGSMNDATISLSRTQYSYTGNVQQPDITVTMGGRTIDPADYDVVIRKGSQAGSIVDGTEVSSVDADTYYVIVTGKNNFNTGTITAQYQITPLSIDHATVTSSHAGLEYDGGQHRINVLVVAVDGVDIPLKLLDITYPDDIRNVGTKEVKITSKSSNFIGTKILKYEIKAKSISDAKVNGLETSVSYNRLAQTQTIVVSNYIGTLQEGIDYDISYTNNVNVGVATLTITGKGNYKDSLDKTFNITAINIDKLTLVNSSVMYNAESQAPEVLKVLAGEIELKPAEYALAYKRGEATETEFKAVGTIEVIVTSLSDNFVGTTSANYVITPAIINSITLKTTQTTYNGTEQLPEVDEVRAGSLLVSDSEYDLEYSAVKGTNLFTDADVITIKVKSKSDNFEASEDAQIQYTILAKNIVGNDVEISYYYVNSKGEWIDEAGNTSSTPVELIGDQTYFGQRVKPMLVYNAGTTLNLTEGTDFDVTAVGADGNPADFTKVDNYTLIVTGKNNYQGSITKQYKVNAAPFNTETITAKLKPEAENKYTYTGSPVTLSLKDDLYVTYTKDGSTIELIADDGYTLYTGKAQITAIGEEPSEDNTIEIDVVNGYYNNLNAGVAMVFIQGKDNFNDGYICVNFTIKKASDATLSLKAAEHIYNGTAQKPEEIVNWHGTKLVKNEDYTVKYENNISAGTAKVIVNGINNFNFENLEAEFTILKKDISDEDVVLTKTADKAYNGARQKPEIVLTYAGMTLTAEDVEITYTRNGVTETDFVLVGTIDITITGKDGNYTGTKTTTFKITKQLIRTIELVANEGIYSGDNQTIIVRVTDVTGAVVANKEYSVSNTPTNIKDVGTIEVVVEGVENSNYQIDRTTLTYTIKAYTLKDNDVEIVGDEGFFYTGSEITPDVVVSFKGKELTKDADYTISYANNIEKGNAKVIVTGIEGSNFTGTVEKTFTIGVVDITKIEVVQGVSDVSYDGKPHKQTPVLRYNGRELTSDDVTINYTAVDFVNVGTITVTLTGINNFGNTKTFTYQITSRSIKGVEVALKPTDLTYTGTAIKPEIDGVTLTVGENVLILVKGVDYGYEYFNFTNAGDATITLTGKGNFIGEENVYYTIRAKQLSKDMLKTTLANTPFTGEEIRPNVTMQNGSVDMVLDTDYSVDYANNINVGTATVTITGMGNYYGSLTTQFEITKLTLTASNVNIKDKTSYEFTGKELVSSKDVVVTVGSNILTSPADYVIDWVSVNYTSVGNKTIIVIGQGNYTGRVTIGITITAVELDESMLNLVAEYVYTGKPIEPEFTLTYLDNTLLRGADYTIACTNNTDVGVATVEITGIGNYNGTLNKTYTITQAMPAVNPELVGSYFEGDKKEDIVLKLGLNDTDGEIRIISPDELVLGLNNCTWEFVPTNSNYKTITGTKEIRAEKIKLSSLEIVTNFKTEYKAYDSFDITGFEINAVYNNGKKVSLDTSTANTNLKIRQENGLDLPSVLEVGKINAVKIYYTEDNITVTSTVEIVVKPIEIMLVFANGNNVSNLKVGDEIKINVDAFVDDENEEDKAKLESHPVSFRTVYKDANGNVVSKITASGRYTVEVVEILNSNYKLMSGNSNSFSIYVKAVELSSAVNGITVTAENGFAEGVRLVLDEIVDKTQIKQILGNRYNEKDNIERIYVVKLVDKGGKAVTGYKLHVNNELFAGKNVYVYLAEELEEQEGRIGIVVIAGEASEDSKLWLILSISGGVVLLTVALITINEIRRRKKKKRLIEKMQQDTKSLNK